LKLARTTIYALTDIAAEGDTTDELMETIIAALAEVATDRQLKPADADRIIELTRLRAEFGDYPEPTLFALDDERAANPWRDKAVEALKAKSPTTEEAANAIVLEVMREHVAGLYGRALPAFERNDAKTILAELARIPAEDRQRVLDRLTEAEGPIALHTVYAAIKPPAPNPVPFPKATEQTPTAADSPTEPTPEQTEAAERERIVMRYAEGAKAYAALFKPAVIKVEHIAAAREAAKAWEAVAEALSERMIAREAAATTVTEEFPEFPPSLLRPKPEPKKNSDAEAAA
jgi:hypothetical protein